MKLVRYGPAGKEKPGVFSTDGVIRDLSPVIPDLGPAQLSPQGLRELSQIDVRHLAAVQEPIRLGPPISGTRNFHVIGMNYPDHIDGRMIGSPSQPMLLTKATSCISGPQDAVILPEGFIKSDWEVELGMVIGSSALDVGEDEALRHVAGYCVVNDISERDEQINQGGQWIKGKSSPTFGPLGPWLVTADEVPEPQTLNLWLEINGERHQSANTSEMIYTCAYLVSYLSKFLRLLPGDVIATGTPGGVGASLRPPRYLRPGDVMHAFVEGLGEQVTPVVAASHDR